MKKLRIIIILLLITGAIIAAKFIFFPAASEKKPATGKPQGPKPKSEVSVYVTKKAEEGGVISASGTILANEEAFLQPETNGRIEYINIPEGKFVSKGTLLLKINDNDITAQLNKIKSQLVLARGSLDRQKKLLDLEGASLQEYEQALSNLNSLKADSAFYLAQIKKTEIRAPFNGVLGIRQVSIGSFVTSATIITSISQIDPAKIDFFLPEKYSSLIKTGDNITCSVEGSNKSFIAKITVKDPRIDEANRSVRFRATCPNPKGTLMPGSFTKIEFGLKADKNTLFIPTQASIATLKGKKVYVIKNGKAEEREIETGLRTAQNLQVISGLSPGDSVIVTGNYQLKAGTPVHAVPYTINIGISE